MCRVKAPQVEGNPKIKGKPTMREVAENFGHVFK
jgi:hypothetical protein